MTQIQIDTKMKMARRLIGILLIIVPLSLWAQKAEPLNPASGKLIAAAREMMASARYCALVTVDDKGNPQARTMDPFLPDSNMIVWLGSNSKSRKVKELRGNSNVTLYYPANGASGYVVIKGKAYLMDDAANIAKYWKPEWAAFYTVKKINYILIKVIPDRLEIVDYKHKITGDSKTWAAPHVVFSYYSVVV